MPDFNIILPSKPTVISEDQFSGIYEVEGLYPGYGHTLGNSLRRIILSSLPGYAITSVKIDGVQHEFSTLTGLKEDVITVILNLKRVRFKVIGDDTQVCRIHMKGAGEAKAGDIKCPGQIEVMNKDQHIATLTDKNSVLDIDIELEKGLGYIPREVLQRDKVEIGTIALDAIFTPIRKVNYEVEQMRVGNRTDFNRLRIAIETDGVITPREALETSIATMIKQLKAIVGFQEEEEEFHSETETASATTDTGQGPTEETTKIKVADLDLSARTEKALLAAGIKTVGGLLRRSEDDLLAVDGLGEKGLQEIKRALSNYGLTLKD